MLGGIDSSQHSRKGRQVASGSLVGRVHFLGQALEHRRGLLVQAKHAADRGALRLPGLGVQ
jgi:hypothetical protein